LDTCIARNERQNMELFHCLSETVKRMTYG
jgi:hypothetical protein